jgi:Ni,Fe-hydrogenase III large subunit
MEDQHNPYICFIKQHLSTPEFLAGIRALWSESYYPLFYFGSGEHLYCGMGKDGCQPVVLQCGEPADLVYPSLSRDIPAFHILERELYEETGIIPQEHPWLKPLRYPSGSKQSMSGYPFLSSDSPSLHEVGVGPVHAGVIEPGHFRFICQGETIQHLEIQLGYQHRGLTRLFQHGDIRHKMCLAESIAGDTSIGHGLAYCLVTEALCGVEVNGKQAALRNIALELERIAMHLADLSALSGDVAYLSGLNFFAAIRTTVINSSLAICGSRFGKRWLKPGGVNYGLSEAQNRTLSRILDTARAQVERCAVALFNSAGVQNRFDSTGIISRQEALELNFSGVTAKAAGLERDARDGFPLLAQAGYRVLSCPEGDVHARAWLRFLETIQSIEMVQELLATLPEVNAEESIELPAPEPERMVISIVEGWRGRIVHVAKTNSEAAMEFYRIYDPSIFNWFALSLAVRGEGISDFPLCNKSFNLSYCGNDL